MTLNGNKPLPLVYNSYEQMSELSGKREQLQKIFNHLNYRKNDRIDAMEFISIILLCIDDSFDQMLNSIIFIFGFSAGPTERTIIHDEFFFFLDCLFRGIMSFVAPPKMIYNKLQSKMNKDSPKIKSVGKRLDASDIEEICNAVFSKKTALNLEGLQIGLKSSSSEKV